MGWFDTDGPYSVHSGNGRVDRVYDIEVAARIYREKHGYALRNEDWATDDLDPFGGLTDAQRETVDT